MATIFHHYSIKRLDPSSKFIRIEYQFICPKTGQQDIQLPIWRPGRYQTQYFAKNIPLVSGQCSDGQNLSIVKTSVSTWRFIAEKGTAVRLIYDYYADQADAGGSVVTEDLCYLNFINCCLYLKNTENKGALVTIDVPQSWHKATSLKPHNSFSWSANSYRELVDSPFISGPNLEHHHWKSNGISVYVQGLAVGNFFSTKLLSSLKRIVDFQLRWMGTVPIKKYHFLAWNCEEAFYHGVEHRASTMMVIGPWGRDHYEDLIGLASHEFFHLWNICTIRPKELLPYAYDKVVYFPTGWVAEGITTYLGDWFLFASGVWNAEEFVAGLCGNLKLHFERDRWNQQNLVESSMDLWLDGYGKAVPGKRVSIYFKGAIVALALDLILRRKFNHQKSLRDVMILMNERYGKLRKGYQLTDFFNLCEKVYGESLAEFWNLYIHSAEDIFSNLDNHLNYIGLSLKNEESNQISLSIFDSQKFERYQQSCQSLTN